MPIRCRLLPLARQLVSYAIFGGTGALTDLAVYTTLVRAADAAPLIANAVSVCCGVLTSFVLNSKFAFRRTDKRSIRLLRFFVVGLTGLALSTGLLSLLIAGGGMDPQVAKLVTIPPVVSLQFVANRLWTFAPLQSMTSGT